MVRTASPAAPRQRTPLSWDPRAAWIWALTLALILYLGFDGGGYALLVRSDVAVLVWWALLLGAALGFRPPGRPGRAAQIALVLFALFAAWSTLSATWSLSSERALDEASRLAAYLGVLGLAIATFGDRDRALRHVIAAVATAIVVIALLAVLTRLQPNLIPSAQTTAQLIPGSRQRLSWPLNYFNALGALVALALPLLLSLATSARWLWARGAAAAAVPVVMLCGYLTFSRGAAVAGACALAVYVALAPRRIPRVATAVLCIGGGALLIAQAVDRQAIENGLTTSAATTEGRSLLVWLIVVCALVGIAQVVLTVAGRRLVPARLLSVPLRPARGLTVAAVALAIVVALAAGAPHHLHHLWQDFTRPTDVSLHSDDLARFTALSGDNRYTYWKTAIDALPGHWLQGFGLGSFQLVWLPRAPLISYVMNAHSLYVETLTEVGLIGLALLAGFLATLLGTAVRRARTADPAARAPAAAAAAAMVSFLVSAAVDWVWQMPVIPVAFLLLAAAALAPAELRPLTVRGPRAVALRAAAVVIAAGCLILIGVPMAMTEAVQSSQADAAAGDLTAALAAARTAIAVEPDAESPVIQAALVLELQRRFSAALPYAVRATVNEPQNWDGWLIASRLEAETGHASQALTDYERARSLNPRSLLFQS